VLLARHMNGIINVGEMILNEFELFTMIFFVLDSEWDESHDEELGQFISAMSPVTFTRIGSAVPEIYDDFLKWLNGRKISLDNSLLLAKEYIESINKEYVSKAFNWIDEKEWLRASKEYLESDHKGKLD